MSFFVNDEDRFGGSKSPRKNKASDVSGMPWKYAFFLLLVIVCVMVVWYLLPSSSQNASRDQIPLIRPDQAPFKLKSQDQSVPGVEHQDKLIYDRIRDPDPEAAPPTEHILPDSEPIKMIEQYTPADADPEAPPPSIEELIEEKAE